MSKKAYTVALSNLPLITDKSIKKMMKEISEMYGFLGVHPCFPKGTLLIFKTEVDAKRCKRILTEKGVSPIGKNIGEIYIEEKYWRD